MLQRTARTSRSLVSQFPSGIQNLSSNNNNDSQFSASTQAIISVRDTTDRTNDKSHEPKGDVVETKMNNNPNNKINENLNIRSQIKILLSKKHERNAKANHANKGSLHSIDSQVLTEEDSRNHRDQSPVTGYSFSASGRRSSSMRSITPDSRQFKGAGTVTTATPSSLKRPRVSELAVLPTVLEQTAPPSKQPEIQTARQQKEEKMLFHRLPDGHTAQQQQPQNSQYPGGKISLQTRLSRHSQFQRHRGQNSQPQLVIFQKDNSNNNANTPTSSSGTALTKQIERKTPFTSICKAIHENILQVQKKINSKTQLYHQFRKLLESKSQYLQGIYLAPEQHEIKHEPIYVVQALMSILNSAEFKYSQQFQRQTARNLLNELEALNKESFNLYLLQSRHEVELLGSKIKIERSEVDSMMLKLKTKNNVLSNPLFQQFSHMNMPITFNKEKYEMMEKRMGRFAQLSTENMFVCSEIEKVLCKLKDISYIKTNPYKTEFF